MKTPEKLLIGAVALVFAAGAAVAVAKPGDLGDEDETAATTTTIPVDVTTTTAPDETTTTAEPVTTTTAPEETTTSLPGGDEGTDAASADAGTTDGTPTTETPTTETPTTETTTTTEPASDSGVGSSTDGNVGTDEGIADTGMDSMAGPGLVLLGAGIALGRLARRRSA